MNVRLEAVDLLPRAGGWTSGRRDFGSFMTFVTGENGAGKTPMMKAIVYSLGHALKLPEDVRAKCAAVQLTLSVEGRPIEIKRTTEDGKFFVHTVDGNERHDFEEEAEFTAWLLSVLGIPNRPLASKEKGQVVRKPYASILTPVFWLDQDRGWQVPYSPLHAKNFVKNQGEEAVRWLLGVAQRNPAVDRAAQRKLEGELESVESLARARQAAITELRSELSDETREVLTESKRRVVERLRAARVSLRSATSAGAGLTDESETMAAALEHARRRLAALAGEREKLLTVMREIEADQEVLLANENAADLFRRVCNNANCSFFRQPVQSFGRRLLFVKDQLKDLQSAVRSVESEIEREEARRADLERSLQSLVERRNLAEQSAGVDGLVAEVDALAEQLQEVTLQLVRREQLAEEERRLSRLILRRAWLRDALEQVSGSRRRVDDRTREVRQAFEKSVARWLRVVDTPNLSEFAVNDHFELTVNGQRFDYDSPESGSTRTRFVLAYHAALIETSMTTGGHHPPWLVCDAPRQQEIKVEDLVNWVEELRKLAKESPFQLVLSGKDVFARIDSKTDVIWHPTFMQNQAFPQYLGLAPSTTAN